MAEKVVLEFEANLDGMQKALARFPDMTEKQAKEAVRQLRKAFLASEKASKKAAKASAKAFAKSSKDIGASADKTGEGLIRMSQAVGGKTGEMAGRVEALGQSVAALATPIGAGTAAAVAFTAAVTGLAAAMVASVFAADDFIDDLKELQGLEGFELLPAEQVQNIENVNASLDAIGAIAKQATVVIAGEFAPAMDEAAVAVVALNLAVLDTIRDVAEAVDMFQLIGDGIINGFLVPVDRVIEGLSILGQSFAKLAAAVGQDELASELNTAVEAMHDLRGQLTTEGIANYIDSTLELTDGYDNLTDRARELIGTMDSLETSQNNVKVSSEDLAGAIDAEVDAAFASLNKTLEAQQKAYDQVAVIGERARESQLEAEQKLTLEYQTQLEQINALANAYPENLAIQEEAVASRLALETAYTDQFAALKKKEADAEKAVQQARVNDTMAVASTLADTANNLAEQRIESMGEVQAAGKSEAQRMFKTQKALAMVGVAIDGASAIIKAFAQFGPPPSPLGIAAAAAAGAATAGALAAIGSQRMPIEFPTGGIVPSMDHQLISAQPGEAVLNRSAVDRLGPSGVDALNSGRAGVGEVVVINRYEHRVFDAFMADHLAQGGPLTNALNQRSGPPGHSRRRR
jgi:hypothetical protein